MHNAHCNGCLKTEGNNTHTQNIENKVSLRNKSKNNTNFLRIVGVLKYHHNAMNHFSGLCTIMTLYHNRPVPNSSLLL